MFCLRAEFERRFADTGVGDFRGRTLDTLFITDEGKVPFSEFQEELSRMLAEPLPVQTFASAPTPIE
jgi:hypothetical protein